MKRLFLTVLAAALAVSTFGQDRPADYVTLNPEIGGNVISYPSYTNNVRMGYSLGANLRVGSFVYLQGGAHLVKHALSANIDTSAEASYYQDISTYYMQFPVVLGLKLINTEPLNLRVFGGIAPSIFLGGDVKNSTIRREDFNHATQAIRFGVGMDILPITLNAYYDWGVTDIYKTPKDITYRALTLAVGIRFY